MFELHRSKLGLGFLKIEFAIVSAPFKTWLPRINCLFVCRYFLCFCNFANFLNILIVSFVQVVIVLRPSDLIPKIELPNLEVPECCCSLFCLLFASILHTNINIQQYENDWGSWCCCSVFFVYFLDKLSIWKWFRFLTLLLFFVYFLLCLFLG